MARASAALTDDFVEDEVTIRGKTYKFRELSIGDYDDLVKKATRTVPNPLTGQDDEQIDNALLLKLMVMKSSTEPKLTPEALANLPTRIAFALNTRVNRLHYGDPDEGIDKPKPGDDGEDESQGNA